MKNIRTGLLCASFLSELLPIIAHADRYALQKSNESIIGQDTVPIHREVDHPLLGILHTPRDSILELTQ